MNGKEHLNNLPDVIMPSDYHRDSKLVSLSIPIFGSKKGRNALFDSNSNFSVDKFKKQVCLSAVWAATSIATNTDLCENGMPIYFHVEDVVEDIAVPILTKSGVPEDWIKQTSFEEYPNYEKIKEVPYGKKCAVFTDDTITTDVCIIWDSDAYVFRYGEEPILNWYRLFENDLADKPMFSFYSDWNGVESMFVNWLLRGVGMIEQEFNENSPTRELDMKMYESMVYASVGFNLPNQQHRWGAAIFSCPRKHPLFEFIAKHHTKSYGDEALVTTYMNANPDTEYLHISESMLDFILEDDVFIDRKSSCIAHLIGRPDKYLKFNQKFLKGIDGRKI